MVRSARFRYTPDQWDRNPVQGCPSFVLASPQRTGVTDAFAFLGENNGMSEFRKFPRRDASAGAGTDHSDIIIRPSVSPPPLRTRSARQPRAYKVHSRCISRHLSAGPGGTYRAPSRGRRPRSPHIPDISYDREQDVFKMSLFLLKLRIPAVFETHSYPSGEAKPATLPRLLYRQSIHRPKHRFIIDIADPDQVPFIAAGEEKS